jgi:predicted GH43/DUF377 family glycosyl hydrolase
MSFIGCIHEVPVEPAQNSGKVFLKIDRENAPENVVFVEAILVKEGQDTLSGMLNLLTGTSADIQFDNVVVGLWNLTVNAKDSLDQIIYTGSAEVTILAGILTQVNLTLMPTGNGTGSIYIFVTWGNVNQNFIDFENNPVLSSQYNGYDNYGIAQPRLIYEDGIYRMWYVAEAGSAVKYVMYAQSTDGNIWTRPYNTPAISPGEYGTWDSRAVHPSTIIKDDGIYKMYYCGFANQNGEWHIGLATSTDGIHWTKTPHPVLYGGNATWESQISSASVLIVNGTYYMFYTGRNAPYNKIGLATSPDGLNWTRYSSNPVLQATESWEAYGVAVPSVIYEDNMFKLVYMNCSAQTTAFGMATSTDGINWTKSSENPVFTDEQTSNDWAADDIAYPFLMKVNNQYRIYYSGFANGTQRYKIGFLRKQTL